MYQKKRAYPRLSAKKGPNRRPQWRKGQVSQASRSARASKSSYTVKNQWVYDVGFSGWEFHGQEGRDRLQPGLLVLLGQAMKEYHRAGDVDVTETLALY